VVSLIAGACSSGQSGSTDDPTTSSDSTTVAEETIAPVEQTAWSRLMTQIGPDGEVPLEMALQAFVLAIGPLPGVDTPEGEPGLIVSGTDPLRWVLSRWDDLTPQQQSAVDAYLPSPEILPGAAGVDEGTDQPAAASGSGTSGVMRTLSYQAGSDPAYACQTSNSLDQLLAQVQSAVETGFGRVLNASVGVCTITGYDGAAYAMPLNAEGGVLNGQMFHCNIVVPTTGGPENALTFHMTYAFFNCFQADLMSIEKWQQLPSWLAAGSAFWVASKTAAVPGYDSVLGPWLTQPGRTLFSRANNAAGFFSLMEDANIDPVTHIEEMLSRWLVAGNTAAYDVAGSNERLLDEWGPGYFADKGKGDPWYFTGTAITGQANAAGEITVANGDKHAIPSASYAATPVLAALTADVVVFGEVGGPLGLVWEAQSSVQTTDSLGLNFSHEAHMTFTYEPFLEENGLAFAAPHGRVYLPDGSDKRLTEALGDAYCMLPEGCECPVGSPGAGRITIEGTEAFAFIGITGHTIDTDLIVEGLSVEEFCELDPQGMATYILTGGSWSTNFHGGIAINGCTWPSASGSGTFGYDPGAKLRIDTTQDPPRYWPFARTNERSAEVRLPQCDAEDGLIKYLAEDVTIPVGTIWFGADFDDDPWKPLTGDVVADSQSWGDPIKTASWTLTRLN
jgi:hypothetical protein